MAGIPKGFNLRNFFGQYFDMILRTGSPHAEELVDLVKERRDMKRCDICGLPMNKDADNPKQYIGAYICDACRRELQGR